MGGLLMSCNPTRNCLPVQLDMPETFGMEGGDSATIADMEWWKIYTDSALVEMIQEALRNNRDIGMAIARIEEAQQLYGNDRVNMLPTLSVQLAADNETNDYASGSFTRDPEFDLKATLSWEADIWGGLRAAQRRGLANFHASIEQARAVRVTLISRVAETYYRLIALDSELAIARHTLFTREEYLNKARLRFQGGLTPETVYRQAQVEYASTAALIPGLEREVQVQQNVLTLLLGRYPQEHVQRGRLAMANPVPRELPIGLPSTLLTKRPDLRAAEAELQAALASVGVAYADRFPVIRIALTGGLENDELAGFFRSPFSYVIGSLTAPVLNWGKNARRHRAAVARYDQARLNYEQKVLTAFSEVSSAAANIRYTRETALRKRQLRDAAQQYASLAFVQYNAGWIAYIDVLDAQRRFFEAEIGLTNAVRDELLSLVYLYRVLGGGW